MLEATLLPPLLSGRESLSLGSPTSARTPGLHQLGVAAWRRPLRPAGLVVRRDPGSAERSRPDLRLADPVDEREALPADLLPAMAEAFGRCRILIVDDDEGAARTLVRVLGHAGLTNVCVSASPFHGIARFAEVEPDLVFLDLHLPGCDGFHVLECLRSRAPGGDGVPIVMLTGDGDVRHRRRALAQGATDFVLKPFNPMEVLLRTRALLETRALHQALSEQNRDLEARVAERTAALEASQMEMLGRLAAAAELHDDETGLHTQRVATVAAHLARGLGLEEARVQLMLRAAPLHDLGKIGIPDLIVRKPGPLNEEEYRLMRTHATIGADILAGGHSELLQVAERIARCHHERWDGTGYPAGLSGEAIPLEARIVAVADFFDALSHERPYRAALSPEQALAMVRDGSGTHFDPTVAAALGGVLWRLT